MGKQPKNIDLSITNRVAYNLKRLRKEKGLTQERLARKDKVDASYIGQIESAKINLGIIGVAKWARILGVDISEFFKPVPGENSGIYEAPEFRKFDAELMLEIIETVEDMFQKKQLHLPPKKKAELVLLIYEELLEDRPKVTSLPGRVLKLVKLAS